VESAIKPVIVFLIAVLAIAFWCIRTVNDFKKKEIRVQEGISGIEVALTKRYDMLTKMLDTAKGYMGLAANVPNILVAALAGIFHFTGPIGAAEGLRGIGIALQGMYLGLLQFKIGETSLNAYWWMLFVVMIPSIAISTLAYIAGFNNVRVFKFKEHRKYY